MAPPVQDGLDALLSEFEPLSADVLAPAVVNEASKQTSRTEQLISYSPPSSAPGPGITSGKSSEELRGIRRARYRARSRNELLYLREVVAELEVELGKRKTQQQVSGSGRMAVSPLPQAKVWKALAARQKLERHEAEVENARLRILLDNQIRFAAQLQHLVHLREGRYGPPSTPRVFRVSIDAGDAEVLETYLSEMDVLYAQTHDVLCETGVDFRPEEPHRVIRMRNVNNSAGSSSGEAGSYAEFLDINVIHADMVTARSSAWQMIIQSYLQRSGSVYTPQTENPDVLTIKYRYPTKWFNREGHITVTHSLKTFNEPNRQVNVYRVLSVGEGALAGMATDETGWCVLAPSDVNPSLTVTRSVTRLSSMRFHSVACRAPQEAPPQLLEFAKILFEFGDQDFAKMLSHFQPES